MGNSKKIFAAVIVFMAAIFCLYSQTSAETNLTNSQQQEQSITISDGNNSDDGAASANFRSTSTVAVFFRMIFVLIIVIALIVGVFWFIKKKTNIVKTDDEYLRRAAYINIAPGKTIEVITLIDKAYLIGVTEDNITMLSEIGDKELIQAMILNADKKANTKKPVNFAEVLDMFLVKGNKGKNVFSDTEQQVSEIFKNTKTNSESENESETENTEE